MPPRDAESELNLLNRSPVAAFRGGIHGVISKERMLWKVASPAQSGALRFTSTFAPEKEKKTKQNRQQCLREGGRSEQTFGHNGSCVQQVRLFSGCSRGFPSGPREKPPENHLKRPTLQLLVVMTTINLMPLGTCAQRNFILVQSPVPRSSPLRGGEIPKP